MDSEKTRLKICGIRSMLEIIELKDFPIDYFGMIFAKSPRKVSRETASDIAAAIDASGKKSVGVFANQSIDEILRTEKDVSLNVIQLHGDPKKETPEFCQKLQEKFQPNWRGQVPKIWKAFSIADTLPSTKEYNDVVEFCLYDTKSKSLGGSGRTFTWDLLNELDPYSFVMAGGIDAENLPLAMSHKPAIVDVNSKVELGNRKDREKVEELIKVFKKQRKKQQ